MDDFIAKVNFIKFDEKTLDQPKQFKINKHK